MLLLGSRFSMYRRVCIQPACGQRCL